MALKLSFRCVLLLLFCSLLPQTAPYNGYPVFLIPGYTFAPFIVCDINDPFNTDLISGVEATLQMLTLERTVLVEGEDYYWECVSFMDMWVWFKDPEQNILSVGGITIKEERLRAGYLFGQVFLMFDSLIY